VHESNDTAPGPRYSTINLRHALLTQLTTLRAGRQVSSFCRLPAGWLELARASPDGVDAVGYQDNSSPRLPLREANEIVVLF
jgi:hypothetical protein